MRVPKLHPKYVGLNAANFLLAEMLVVIAPFLSVFLRENGWSYIEIGFANAAGTLGLLVMQIPAGLICDKIKDYRLLLGVCSVLIGFLYASLVPLAHQHFLILTILFSCGAIGAFFTPLLTSLAYNLAGQKFFPRMVGANQSWNHAGNLFSSVVAAFLIGSFGLKGVFFSIGLVSILIPISLLLIKKHDLRFDVSRELNEQINVFARLRESLADPSLRPILLAMATYSFATMPVLSLLGLYFKDLGAPPDRTAWLSFASQALTVPISYLAGRAAVKYGRKKTFLLAFISSPLRILAFTVLTNVTLITLVQMFDGFSIGIWCVLMPLIANDLKTKNFGLNQILGLSQVAASLGGFLAAFCEGFLVQNYGYEVAFAVFGFAGVVSALIFWIYTPETKPGYSQSQL